MKVELEFPQQVFDADKDYPRFFEALQLMLNRMAMAHFSYGAMRDAHEHGDVDQVRSGRQRLMMYDGLGRAEACDCKHPDPNDQDLENDHTRSCFLNRKKAPIAGTGNTENLLDAANCFIIAYLFPRHPRAHFKAQETKESPGLARL